MHAQLGQRRGVAAVEHLGRVLVVDDRQQRREVAHVLLELVEDRGDPALAEPDPRPHALRLQLLRAGVGGLLEQRDARLAPQLLAVQERRVGAERDLHAGDALRGVPVRGVLLRADLQVELHARARRLGRDRVGRGREPLDAVDRDGDVLAAGLEDLLVDQRVARVGAQRLVGEVFGPERRQDADHHDVRADRLRALLGVVQAGAQRRSRARRRCSPASRRGGTLISMLNWPSSVWKSSLAIALSTSALRIAGLRSLVDEVELDLEAGHRPVELELRLAQHPREHVEALPHLRAVALAVLAAELPLLDVLPHAPTFRQIPCGVKMSTCPPSRTAPVPALCRPARPTASPCACTPRRRRRSSARSPPRSGAAGGLVTAIDVSESRADRITDRRVVLGGQRRARGRDRRRAARGRRRHGAPGVGPHVPAAPRRQDLGRVEGAAATRDDLSMAYTPGVGRVSLALAAHPEDVAKLTVKGNAVAVVTDGSAVLGLGNIGPGRRAAGDGGQGRAVQAVRQHRRLADLPRHAGHRRDRAHRQGHLARLRRDQPRGHLRAALLRDRAPAARRRSTSRSSTTTSTAPRSSSSPR